MSIYQPGGAGQTAGRDTVRQRRHDPGSRRKNIINGTRTGSDLSDSFGGVRILDLYVGGCKNDTNPDTIINFCRKYHVEVKKCELLSKNSEWLKSYKVSVNSEDRAKLLESEFWPTGIFVRKFFKGRSRRES